jgi:hypothetical protein
LVTIYDRLGDRHSPLLSLRDNQRRENRLYIAGR